MKKIYSILLLAFIATVFSCSDDALDPLRTKEVKKGKLLALRGKQLDKLYNKGTNGDEFFPGVVPADQTFNFDAEYLSDDPTSLKSFDIYAVKKTKVSAEVTTTERIHLKNVPFSEFKTTDDYPRPWVSVSIKLKDILTAIGISDPNSVAGKNELLTVYQPGIDIESDLNLSDGSVLPSSQIIAQGLFESDQFYPAMRLVYASVEFCPYIPATWDGLDFRVTELYGDGSVSPTYHVTLEAIGNDKYIIHGLGVDNPEDIMVEFQPAATTTHDQNITLISDKVQGEAYVADNTGGSYDQCSQTFSIVVDNDDNDDDTYTTFQFDEPQ